jgi:hypothetical protein
MYPEYGALGKLAAIGDSLKALQLQSSPIIARCMRDWLVMLAHLDRYRQRNYLVPLRRNAIS